MPADVPGASRDAMRERAEHVRDKVRHLHVQHKNHTIGPITPWLDVAAFPHDGSTGEAALKSADVALYEAKRRGGNCVVVAS